MAHGIINSLKKRTVYEMTSTNTTAESIEIARLKMSLDISFLLRAERDALAEIEDLSGYNGELYEGNLDFLTGKLHAYNEALELVQRAIDGDLALRTANI